MSSNGTGRDNACPCDRRSEIPGSGQCKHTVSLTASTVFVAVLVEDALRDRDDLATGAKQEPLHIVFIRRLVVDDDAVVIEGASGHEHMEGQVQLQVLQRTLERLKTELDRLHVHAACLT